MKNLVDGFTVDERTPKPDCQACTEAKLSVKPFPTIAKRRATRPGQITHLDISGKISIESINGNQYFMVLVDGYMHRVKVDPMPTKDTSTEKAKAYLMYLKTHGMNPEELWIDGGGEFKELVEWCKEEGIHVQMTAPYSPSQNGTAERMMRTLVELGRAMLQARKLPHFLWELAVLHAAYIRDRAYTRTLQGKTPFEAWEKEKPNVAHLREFGSPVWILRQGQHKGRKFDPKSTKKVFVGFEDGSRSVKYYNPETRKILTSRNYRFLSVSDNHPEPTEGVEIDISPEILHEGEQKEVEMLNAAKKGNN